jgi:cytochrome d ubiquinol oxidase subunit I
METLGLARWQFGITTVYHFFFVPLTLGLSILVALMETAYVRTGKEVYKQMAKFWGKLFLINFAMGVATGIVQEFQFGMNWSEYSRFVGDIFGAPLAVEALLAFFIESTFLGIWIFGWDKLSKKMHLASIWLVAIGSNLSALWIIIANAWMQNPVGYVLRNGRAEMQDFFALLTNPHLPYEISHVFFGGVVTAAFFVLGISAWQLLRGNTFAEFFQRSFRWGAVAGLIGSVLVMLVGHGQGQWLERSNPMKLAAAEANWKTKDRCEFLIAAGIDEKNQKNTWSLPVGSLLSILAYNSPSGVVKGMTDLQVEFTQKYGPGDYIPPVAVTFWSFRLMVASGLAMLLLALLALWRSRGTLAPRWLLGLLVLGISLPYLGNSTGWMLAELGRQPWLVFGLMKTSAGLSLATTAGEVLLTVIGFTALYGALMVVDVWLLRKYAALGPVTAND